MTTKRKGGILSWRNLALEVKSEAGGLEKELERAAGKALLENLPDKKSERIKK